jgi:hypothetical protein
MTTQYLYNHHKESIDNLIKAIKAGTSEAFELNEHNLSLIIKLFTHFNTLIIAFSFFLTCYPYHFIQPMIILLFSISIIIILCKLIADSQQNDLIINILTNIMCGFLLMILTS